MKAKSGPGRGAISSGHSSGFRHNVGARAVYFTIVVWVLSLSACAGRLPAPVDSRVDDPVTREAAAESATPAPSAASASAGVVQPSASQSSVSSAPAEVEIAPLEMPDVSQVSAEASEGAAGAGEIAPQRLASLNPAIKDLLNDANRHSAAGRHDGAAASLERALQIEGKDAALWHRLARTRLDQGRAGLAEALAAKSNSLAAGDSNLQAQNWRLIAKARQRLGDESGADDALARAARLTQ